MNLEIPDELRDAFLGFLEFSIDNLLTSFGSDLPKNEIRLMEFLIEFVKTERS